MAQQPSDSSVSIVTASDAPNLDSVSNATITVGFSHHEIHEGDSFFIINSVVVNDGIDLEIRIQTPDTAKWAHMVMEVVSTGETDLDLYESTSLTHVGGNALTAINRNRNSANTSGLTICHTPAGSGDGTLIVAIKVGIDTGSGANHRLSGGNANARGEIILKQNTAYLARISSGTDGNRIAVVLDWYEHTNSN